MNIFRACSDIKLPAPVKGMLLATITFALFSANDTALKTLTHRYSNYQIVSMTYGFGVLFILGWSFLIKKPLLFRKVHLHVLRGLAHSVAITGVFIGIANMPLANYYVINFMTPLLVTLFSALILKEKLTIHLLMAMLISFAGVLVAFRPGDGMNQYTLLCFGGMFFYAASVLFMRKLAATESMPAIMLSVNAIVASVLTVFGGQSYILPDMYALVICAAVAGTSLIAYSIFIMAMRLAPASLATIPMFLQLIYGAIAGYLVFGDVPKAQVYFGGAIIIIANLYLLYMQNKPSKA